MLSKYIILKIKSGNITIYPKVAIDMKIHCYIYQRDCLSSLHFCPYLDDDGDSRQDEDCATPPPGEIYMIVYL